MSNLVFWLRQPEMNALVAAYLLAGYSVPEELSYSVSTTNYPPKVAAMIELIRNTTGAVHRNHVPIGKKTAPRLRTTISQEEFRSLAVKQEVALEPCLPEPSSGHWPWGTYDTKLLRTLAQAADKFWRLYDPGDPSTAPTNEQLVAWLIEHKVSKNLAQSMATILRADDLPAGPRK